MKLFPNTIKGTNTALLMAITFCLTSSYQLSASTIVLPSITLIHGDNGTSSGVNTTGGSPHGSIATNNTNVTFISGDTVEVTLIPEAGMKFRILSSSTGTLSITYGSDFPFGTNYNGTGTTITFNGLSGGIAPPIGLVNLTTDSLNGPANDALTFGTSIIPSWSSAPDTVEFSSVTLRSVVTNPTAITVNTVPELFNFSAGTSQLTQIPVPEPSASALFCLAGASLVFRSRR